MAKYTRRLSTYLAVLLLVALVAGFAQYAPSYHADASSAAVRDTGAKEVQLVASAARTATGTGDTVCRLGAYSKFALQLLVTAHSGTTPTLDVTWQHSIDGGTTWYTVAAFTQVTTTDGAQLKVEAEVEAATAEVYGDCMRAIWTVSGTTPSYTFSVKGFFE